MIKKLTITSLTALSLLLVTAQAEEVKTMNEASMAKMGTKMHAQRKDSPFLIKHGIPHMTHLLKMSWDDAKLALTPEQKEKLLAVRKETMGSVKALKPQVQALRKEIREAAVTAAKATDLKSKVEKLAVLEAEATMAHLKCLDDSKAVLKPEQVTYIMEFREKIHHAIEKASK